MATLLDLVNVARKVKVGDQDVEVYGVSTEGVIKLVTRFPALLKALSGLEPDKDELFKVAPEAISAIIAAGCGDPGNEKAEKVASRLPIEAQLNLVAEIIKCTFPKGVGPFVERLQELGLLVKSEADQLQSQGASQPSQSSEERLPN